MSKRERFAQYLHRSGSLHALLKLRSRASIPWLSILTYHRFPANDGLEPFDDGVIDVTPEEFDRQVGCLKKYFAVIGVDELCGFAAGRPLPKNPVVIAFDDGYLGNYETALPILKKHDAKAIFFIATSFTTERRPYWWDRIAYVLKTSSRRELTLEYPFSIRIALAEPRIRAIEQVLRLVKVHPSLDLDRFLNELGHAAGVPWSGDMDRRFSDRLLMTWDHVRSLRKAGMDVQSHTRTHRVLQTLSPEELADELEGSRADLARELGEPARALAYPVGNPLELSSPVRAAMRKAGYEIGLTNGTGPTSLRQPVDPFNFCRQTIGRNLSDEFFMTILALPEVAPKHPWPMSAN
jgi:peptidoglycan/xylan/chitin deacetylase (PgdA/CDA1 family)